MAYFISQSTGNVFPVFKSDALIGRFDSVTGMRPEVDLTNEDQSRNISRRHARLVIKDGKPFVAEEIGTMNGTFLNGKKLANGVLTPIGDELVPAACPQFRPCPAFVRRLGSTRLISGGRQNLPIARSRCARHQRKLFSHGDNGLRGRRERCSRDGCGGERSLRAGVADVNHGQASDSRNPPPSAAWRGRAGPPCGSRRKERST
jgi:hypothetical protein